MPARVIRAEINASRSLSRVSLEADLTFRCLLVVADDFGRFDADPLILRSALFPRRTDVTAEQIERWLSELADEGCLAFYKNDGDRYLLLVNWEKHRGTWKRTKRGKYPAPPDILPESPKISRNLPKSPLQSGSGSGLGSGYRLGSGAEAAGTEPEAARASQAARPPEKSTEAETEPDAPSTGFGAWCPPAEQRESLATSGVFSEMKAKALASRRLS